MEKPVVFKGMNTPWGQAEDVNILANGIGSVLALEKGGVKVRAKENKQIPEYMRAESGWYEGDFDWAIPFCIFESEILAFGVEYACENIREKKHIRCLRRWLPVVYEQHFNN